MSEQRSPKTPRRSVRRASIKSPVPPSKPDDSSSQPSARPIDFAKRLQKLYPDARCALNHETPWQLLIATILSAQCTDVRVNLVTPALFKRYPGAKAMAEADRAELEKLIQSTGFYRNKAANILACCKTLVDKHHGEVPRTLEELTPLGGVGRKTANVVLGNAYGIPGLPVDTHVGRLSRRMGLTTQTDPVKVEKELMEELPPKEWTLFSLRMIDHGRAVCFARKPQCASCDLADICPKIDVAAV